jgi:uncharacterized phiE125 gp8 family phage protein
MSLKVVTPPTLTTVVATADLRTHLRLATDGTEDGLATTYLAAAHAAAEHYAGRPIGSQTLELALDAFPEGEIALTPAVSAAAESAPTVKYTDLAGVEQTVSATDYSLSTYGLTALSGRPRRTCSTQSAFGSWQATFRPQRSRQSC